jgi:serine/threonine protein kinase
MKVCIVCDSQYGEDLEVCPQDGSSLMPDSLDPYIGHVIQDRYRIESLIAKGSMGAVYLAKQLLIKRAVAIKVLLHHLGNDDAALKRFQREAKAASKLNHRHITTLYDFGVMPDGQPYLVMDYLNGVTLDQVIEQRGCLSPDEFRPILRQVCEAIGYAHTMGIIHRDIKPENIILLEKDGRNDFVKVVDFGVAKLIADKDPDAKLTKTGTICGSPAYLSPEQARSVALDPRSDVYSLGIVIFETLTGVLPFTAGDLINLLFLHATQAPPLISEVRADLRFTPEIVHVVNRALAKDPADRQQSMEELWREFDHACGARGEAVSVAQNMVESREYEQPAYEPPAQSTSGPQEYIPPPEPTIHEEPPSLPETMADDLRKIGSGRFPILSNHVVGSDESTTRAANGRDSSRLEALPRTFAPGADPTNTLRTLAPYMAGMAVVIVIAVFLYSQFASHSPAWLMEHGRYEEALHSLQVAQASGKLRPNEFEQLNTAYVSVANHYVQQGRLQQAVALLNQVSPKSKKSREAKRLMRNLKRRMQTRN